MHMADALVSPAVGGVMIAASAGLLWYGARELFGTGQTAIFVTQAPLRVGRPRQQTFQHRRLGFLGLCGPARHATGARQQQRADYRSNAHFRAI